jgi:hypothetical protein
VDRLAAKTGAALFALTLMLGAPAPGRAAAGTAGKGRKAETAERRRAPVQLEAVSITGTPEHPAILFFLPRAKFRLLPYRTGRDWKERILTETREMGDAPR